MRGDPLRERVVLGGDRREQPERALGNGGQPRARALHLLGERRFRTRQRIVADKRAIADRSQHVGKQRIGRDRRLQLQRRLRESRRAFFVARERVVEREADQADDAGARRRSSPLPRVSSRAIETRVAVVDERGIAGDPLPAAIAGQRLRQIAEIPPAQAAPLDAGAGLRERELRRFAELRAQRGEIAAARELVAGGVDDRDVDDEMRREHDGSSQSPAAAFRADRAREPRAERVRERRRCRGRRPPREMRSRSRAAA